VIEYGNAGEIYTNYAYNAAGDLLTVTNALNHSTAINYDCLGRKINMNDPDMGYWQYTYDANGNLITQTDAKNQTITFAYDPLDRVTSKSYAPADPEANPDVTYKYDEIAIDNGIGRLYRIENTHAVTTIDSYDKMGRQSITSRTISGAPANPYTTTYNYDFSGKIVGMTYPDGYQVEYSFHPSSSLLHKITGKTDDIEYAEFTGYQPTGKIGELYHGNGAQTHYDYDPESTRLLSIQTLNPVMADIQEKSYKYSAAGDILKIFDTSADRNITYNYGYDKLHRLVSETSTGGSDTYPAAILDKTFDDNAPVHAVKSIFWAGTEYIYDYDSNGNMTAGWDFTDPDQVASRSLTFNADNMPVEIQRSYGGGSATIHLSYDGDGKRVKKAVAGGGTTYYISNHFEVEAGTETKYIFGGNLRVAKVTSSTSLFYHKDHLGSSTAVTGYADGTQVETTEYMPFGLSRNKTGTEVTYYKFTDQELDPSTGLYNYNARLYDPAVANFISPDSIVPDWQDSQLLNRYSYVRNNPLKFIDPTGHFLGRHSYSGLLMSNQNDPPPQVLEVEGRYIEWESGRTIGQKALESPLIEPGDILGIGAVFKGGGKLLIKGAAKRADNVAEDILVNVSKKTDIKAIGKMDDVKVAKDWPNHGVLDVDNYGPEIRKEWVGNGIKNKQDFYTASP